MSETPKDPTETPQPTSKEEKQQPPNVIESATMDVGGKVMGVRLMMHPRFAKED